MLVASKKAITRRCLTSEPPTKEDWTGIIKEVYNMEELTFFLNLQMGSFICYWRKWITYLDEGVDEDMVM